MYVTVLIPSVQSPSFFSSISIIVTSQAWCLNLEYSISGAAVAASWGSKVLNICSDEVVSYMYPPMTPLFSVNIFAGKTNANRNTKKFSSMKIKI